VGEVEVGGGLVVVGFGCEAFLILRSSHHPNIRQTITARFSKVWCHGGYEVCLGDGCDILCHQRTQMAHHHHFLPRINIHPAKLLNRPLSRRTRRPPYLPRRETVT
jgi:hypothetical protein